MMLCSMHPKPRNAALLCLIALLASCGDDPELVARREQQKTEIAKLRGEITLLEEQLKNMPEDVSAQLEEAKAKETEQKAEIARLEEEIKDLQTKKRELSKEFDLYRARYQTN